MSKNLELFKEPPPKAPAHQPLADRLRPRNWEAFQGLEAIDRNLTAQLRLGRGNPPSLVLWGPPGSGKTTLAKLIGASFDCSFVEFSAVLSGVKDVREVVAEARRTAERTILFVDEIHRFNKAQQDAFLPHIEDGTIILIGATTENPSFYLTGALLSRLKVIVLPPLSDEALARILESAGREAGLDFDADAARVIADYAGGDARRLLNLVEAWQQAHPRGEGEPSAEAQPTAAQPAAPVTGAEVKKFLQESKTLFYDRGGEEHYNMISAFIKSLRGSDPDAALFWGFRMLESGEDPRFLLRRMIIFASEDIGNADPRALQVAVAAAEAFDRVGLPEGRIPTAQCITYLASAPKSNRSYQAMHAAVAAVGGRARVEVPVHLRNAPTKLMEQLGYGREYLYPHSTEGGYAPEVQYLPDELAGTIFYEPTDRGYEKMIKERLDYWRGLRKRV